MIVSRHKGIEAVLQQLSEITRTVEIRKLARATHVGCCHESLWSFLGLTRADIYPCNRKYPQVSDYPYDIWCCKIGKTRGYGRSLFQAVERALAEPLVEEREP